MNARIQTRLPAAVIWQAWQRSHAASGLSQMESGKKGESKTSSRSKFKYQIQEIIEGESFSILWKSFLTSLLFTYKVTPFSKGSEISCSVKVRGLLAGPVRWMLGNKIRKNLESALHALVRQLER
ncbi:MAG: hypothetical protein IT584_00445 [Chlamydiae bacterium]|nr:hypothetical protein [Chlamydiota bacterium]